MVLRPARRRGEGAAGAVFGVRRWIRPPKRLRGGRIPTTPTTTPSSICSTPWCASRCWSPTGHRGGPGFRCWRRSASSPRNNSSPAARRRGPGRACPLLRRARSRHPRPVGQPAPTRGVRLVHRRAGQSAHRVPVGRRPRRPRRRRRHRHVRDVTWRNGRKSTSRSPGPKSSSSPPAPSTIPGSRRCT